MGEEMNSAIRFNLPFEVDAEGFPSYDEIVKRGFSCGGLITDVGELQFEHFSNIFRKCDGDTFRLYVYEDNFASFGTFTVGKSSIGIQTEHYSIYNLIFEDERSGNCLFISDNDQWLVFIGSETFVSECMSCVEDPIQESKYIFESTFYNEEQRLAGLRFINTYSRGQLGAPRS
jgi:hypothetical protein